MVYERIVLAPRYGPQVGFEFGHAYPVAFILTTLCFLLSHLWLVVWLVFVAIRPAQGDRNLWVKFGLLLLTLVVFHLTFGLTGEAG
jgi:hypothetical protein